MLILRRKKNESILIGDNIRLTVIETAADGVRIAIDAPKHISILREELSHAEEANRSAVAGDSNAIFHKKVPGKFSGDFCFMFYCIFRSICYFMFLSCSFNDSCSMAFDLFALAFCSLLWRKIKSKTIAAIPII